MIDKDKIIDILHKKVLSTSNMVALTKIRDELNRSGKMRGEDILELAAFPDRLGKIDEGELYTVIDAIHKLFPQIIDATSYFSDGEIAEYRRYRQRFADKSELYVLRDAFPLAKNQWSCLASVEQISLMKREGIIRADSEFQRQSRLIKARASDELLRRIQVNRKRVDEIADLIVSGDYSYNTLRFNLMDTGDFYPQYNAETHEIVIPKGGEVVELDGNHRTIAAEKAYFDHPELREYFSTVFFHVAFTFYDATMAHMCMTQEWKTEKVNTAHAVAMDIKMGNQIVNEIRRSESAERMYSTKIVTTWREISLGQGFLMYSVLLDSVNRYFGANSIKLKSDAMLVAKKIINVFNYVCSLQPDVIDNFVDTRKTNWLVNPYTWGAFVCFASMDLSMSWRPTLKKVIDDTNWDIEASPDLRPTANSKSLANAEVWIKEAVNRAI